VSWDPNTGYLRVPLRAVPAGVQPASDCRLEFTAEVRLGLRQGLGGDAAICYVELSALPAVARSILTGSVRVATVAGTLRIPVRPSLANRVVAGPAAVSLELGGGVMATVTLHLRSEVRT
jgi:hypothetical protein